MPELDPPSRLCFDVFELDLRTGELRRDGLLIKLQDQPTKLLTLLATRAGELVTRADIQKALWTDSTFVEFESAINTAMRKIREALGDNLEEPRFIETLPRKGYRFLPRVEAVPTSHREKDAPAPSDGSDPKVASEKVASEAEGTFPLKVGQVISHYRVEEKLGQGGMGVVYRAKDMRLGRTVALKMLLPQLAADRTLRRRLEAEARAASSLNHPVIATVYAYEEVGDSAFIVFEYVEGITLRQAMRKGPMELAELLSIFIRIADGLSVAHEAGMVHRDLKPENVMMTETRRVKILDFGLAKLPPPIAKGTFSSAGTSQAPTISTPPGLLVGTVDYMSPEQLEAEKVDHRTDVFSFGVMLYEMTARRHPFVGKSPSSTIGNILKEEPASLTRWAPQAPAELERVIGKCLRKERAERYQTVRDLLVDLEKSRRELAGPASGPAVSPEMEFALPRGISRALFLAAQVGYLALYVAALYFIEGIEEGMGRVLLAPAGLTIPLVIVSAMCGIAVRLYLLSSVGWGHPDAGRQFRRLFPAMMALDSLWATAPLFLAQKMGYGLAFGSVAALAYLPFAQRTLILSVYRDVKPGNSGISRSSS